MAKKGPIIESEWAFLVKCDWNGKLTQTAIIPPAYVISNKAFENITCVKAIVNK